VRGVVGVTLVLPSAAEVSPAATSVLGTRRGILFVSHKRDRRPKPREARAGGYRIDDDQH
jgi:hypothetical protein